MTDATSPQARPADLNPTRTRMFYVTLFAALAALASLVLAEVLWDIPDMVLGLAVGAIGGLFTTVNGMVGFFFGTSSGSAAKEQTAAAERMVAVRADAEAKIAAAADTSIPVFRPKRGGGQ